MPSQQRLLAFHNLVAVSGQAKPPMTVAFLNLVDAGHRLLNFFETSDLGQLG